MVIPEVVGVSLASRLGFLNKSWSLDDYIAYHCMTCLDLGPWPKWPNLFQLGEGLHICIFPIHIMLYTYYVYIYIYVIYIYIYTDIHMDPNTIWEGTADPRNVIIPQWYFLNHGWIYRDWSSQNSGTKRHTTTMGQVAFVTRDTWSPLADVVGWYWYRVRRLCLPRSCCLVKTQGHLTIHIHDRTSKTQTW